MTRWLTILLMVLCGGAFANLPHQYDANVGLASRLSWACDAYDRVTAFTNAEQQVTRQQWNARGGLTMLTDPATHTVLSGHDPAGNQITLTNRRSKGWQFNFDAANRLTGTITPMGRSNALVFNNRGLLQAGTDPMGRTTTFGYDAKGRTTSRADQAATSTCGYDANGSLTSVVELGGTNAWVLDAYDRVSSYKDADGNLVQYKYDPNGNLANLVYPGGKTVSYVYDSLNRLTNVTDWANRKTTFAYDLASRVTSITRPNGTVRLINYDAAGETTNIVEKTLGNFPIAFFTLAWNNSGRVAWEFAGPLPHPYTPPYRSMGYNDDNQITTLNSTNTLVYDFDGNMTTGPLTNNALTTYSYDARNRLVAAGGLTCAYDPAGNRTSVTNGTNVVRFVVNPSGALPQTLIRTQPDGSQTLYVYGLGLLYEVNLSSGETELNTRTYHYDYRGSTVALTDANGMPTDRIDYSPYGMTTYRAGTTDTPFLYNGCFGVQTDPNGLLYMRARYYNPFLCRFINPDPSGFAGGLNWYCYADGNPISMMDPFGLGAGSENLWSWLGNNAAGAARVGYGWSYDQVHDLGATMAGLGSEAISSALGMAAQSVNSPGLNQLSGSFNGWAQDLYGSRRGFARAGWYDASSPAIQAANVALIFLNPDSAAGGGLSAAESGSLEIGASETWGNASTLERHFADHGADFGATSAEDYANQASQFFQRSQAQRLPTTIDANGVIRVYDPSANTFGAFNANGTTRTFFTPTSPTYFQRQPGTLVP